MALVRAPSTLRWPALTAGGLVLALASMAPRPSMPLASALGLDCPSGMVPVRGFCIDTHEAATEVVDVGKDGKVHVVGKHSPFKPIGDERVRAVPAKGRVPQGHISQEQAAAACKLAGKRLCSDEEWITACKGKKPTTFPYGDDRVPGRCNDEGRSGMNLLFGGGGAEAPEGAYTQENMNDERLNRTEGSLAVGGRHTRCKSSYGAFDMVGNLHEWTSAGGGTFRGGYYLDVTINGDGCDYKTTAHSPKYFDYSTGFRCCWSPGDDAKRRAEERRLVAEKKAEKKREEEAERAVAARAKAAGDKRDAAEASRKKADADRKRAKDAREADAERKRKADADRRRKADANGKKKAKG